MRASITIAALALCLAGCGRSDEACGAAPVGWWKFDEGSGIVAADASGSDNTATVRNGRWASGKRGGGLAMSGTVASDAVDDGIVIVPISDTLRSTRDGITVMAWAYRTVEHNVAVVAHQYPVLFFGFHGPGFKWQVQGEPSTGLVARVARTLGFASANGDRVGTGRGASCYRDLEQRAELDRWIHMAGTYDGRTARLYVDGVEICSRPFRGAIKLTDSPFTISGYLNESNEIIDEMSGTLDDVRIYARALTATKIREIYEQGSD